MKTTTAQAGAEASASISKRIEELSDWRGATLARVRELIHAADLVSRKNGSGWVRRSGRTTGILCTGESYKQVVKLTFARGASIPDPKHLFNASLDGNTRRAIDLREGETLNATAFKQLIRASVALNAAVLAERAAKKKKG